MGFGLDDCVALQGRFKGGALQGKAKRSSSSSADAERQEEWFASLQERRAETIEKLAIKKAKRDQKELVRTLHLHLQLHLPCTCSQLVCRLLDPHAARYLDGSASNLRQTGAAKRVAMLQLII